MKDRFKKFCEEFDRHWVEQVYKRFSRDYTAGAPDEVLMNRYALRPNQLRFLKNIYHNRKTIRSVVPSEEDFRSPSGTHFEDYPTCIVPGCTNPCVHFDDEFGFYEFCYKHLFNGV